MFRKFVIISSFPNFPNFPNFLNFYIIDLCFTFHKF